MDWLGSSGDPSTNHNSAVKKREPETGIWFLESDEFYSWMRSHGFLWLHGIRAYMVASPRNEDKLTDSRPLQLDAARQFCGTKPKAPESLTIFPWLI